MAGRLPDLAGFPYASYTQKASMVSGTSCPSESKSLTIFLQLHQRLLVKLSLTVA
jgi:hypothetical protein